MSSTPTPSSLSLSTVTIIGLGMMGGSLGLALDGACAHRIGVDLDHNAANTAVLCGAVDEHSPLATAVARADIVVLCVPVRQAILLAPDIAAWMRPNRIITDISSTKVEVCNALDCVDDHIFSIGGHPMCGRELSGISNAKKDLFCDAQWVLTQTVRTTPAAQDLVMELVQAVGSVPILVDRFVHDRAVVTASHLPYVVAQALVTALMEANSETLGVANKLAASGFRSATRLANGDVDMWLDVLTTNQDNVRSSIGLLQSQLSRLVDALDDSEYLNQLLIDGRTALQAIQDEHTN